MGADCILLSIEVSQIVLTLLLHLRLHCPDCPKTLLRSQGSHCLPVFVLYAYEDCRHPEFGQFDSGVHEVEQSGLVFVRAELELHIGSGDQSIDDPARLRVVGQNRVGVHFWGEEKTHCRLATDAD